MSFGTTKYIGLEQKNSMQRNMRYLLKSSIEFCNTGRLEALFLLNVALRLYGFICFRT